MAKSDALDALQLQRSFLLGTGLWPEREETMFKKIRFLTFHLISISYCIMTTIELFHFLDDYKILTDHLAVMTSLVSFLVKLFFFELKRNKFLELLDLITNYKSFRSYPNQVDHYLEDMITLCSRMAKLYFAFCGVVLFLYCVMPLLGNGSLPVRISYDLGNYWFYPMYLYQVIALWSMAANNACMDISAAGFIGIAVAQLDILKFKILNFANARSDDATAQDDNESYQQRSPGTRLHRCVDHHNDIMTFVTMIEDVFTWVFLAQFMTSMIVICNIGFQLAHFAKMLCYFVAMMLQLGMYCWFGNEVTLKNHAIGNACYESDWIDRGISIRQSLTLIIHRCSKPLRLTAGNYSTLSLSSFGAVINSSYTYFALMQRLYKDSNK